MSAERQAPRVLRGKSTTHVVLIFLGASSRPYSRAALKSPATALRRTEYRQRRLRRDVHRAGHVDPRDPAGAGKGFIGDNHLAGADTSGATLHARVFMLGDYGRAQAVLSQTARGRRFAILAGADDGCIRGVAREATAEVLIAYGIDPYPDRPVVVGIVV